MRPITDRQKTVLDFIREFQRREGFPPTQAEIARGLGFRSANAAAEHLRLLAKKGRVELTPGVARGLRLIAEDETAAPTGLPLIGQVAAGQPILAEERIEATLAVDPALFRPRADYLLRVRGDSMIDAGIRSGDLVAVHRQASVESGRIAVVRLGDEVTVKRWRKEGDRIVLEPANEALRPVVVDPRRDRVALEGLVVGLLRLGAEMERLS